MMPSEWGAPPPAEEGLPGLESTALADTRIPVAADRIPELESTRVADPAAPVSATPMLELDLGRAEALDLPPMGPMPELELHGAAAVGAVALDPIALETTRIAPPDDPSPPSASVKCPECEHEQAGGVYCDACGHRLRVFRAATEAAATGDTTIPCEGCSVPVQPGTLCRNCGVFNRLPET